MTIFGGANQCQLQAPTYTYFAVMVCVLRLLVEIALPVCCVSALLRPVIDMEGQSSEEWEEWPKLQCDVLSRDFCDSRFGCKLVNGLCVFDPSLPITPVDCSTLSLDVRAHNFFFLQSMFRLLFLLCLRLGLI